MKPLRSLTDIATGEPIDRDTRRARLLAARRAPVCGIVRKGILGGHWDGGTVVGAFRGGRGTFLQEQTLPGDQERGEGTSGEA
ncbi:hypothetical protein AX777_22655 [Sphingobium yanoikuyae]|jgi:hypothetical protein|uniref:Uncharacterized protein n=2 Tax=Sphingobium TaxID=165695 RepID=A0A177JJ77_SPHYA|nr:hypothetical protein [Sphingobium indicum]AYO75477.1 hypothetical protein EBF16_00210 [Sphingobium yanoikuyae]PHP17098.1 hypothetical protein CG471_24630 [Sphingobium sp. IP1]RSU73012.1 hypothetical protein BRX37_17220 [Sphingomonas sp. S-NIH.Pt3_0716]KER37702.1 hypothetical protein AL00_03805 [Sphingobium indicum F2]OAH40977.1 hypothetical protein AX777_22655 [Sphingobium yanoikuyae]